MDIIVTTRPIERRAENPGHHIYVYIPIYNIDSMYI